MRIVFIGASTLTEATARMMLAQGHEAVIVAPEEDKLDAYRESLDCGLVKGDGTRPAVLREVSPKHTDFLLCLGESDQANIIASLVGRALGFERIVTKIDDPDFEKVCIELDLQDTIMPQQEVGEALLDLIRGRQRAALSAVIRGQVRFHAFEVSKELAGKTAGDIDFGKHTHPVAVNRVEKDESKVVDDDTKLHEGDELVVVTQQSELDRLHQTFGPKPEENGDAARRD